MSNDNVQGAQNLLKGERDERTGEFLQGMLNSNLGEASKALKQPNFDPSDRANGAQLDWQPDAAWTKLSLQRLWDLWVHMRQMG